MQYDVVRNLCGYCPYDKVNKCVFRRLLNLLMSVSLLSLMGKSVQILGPIEVNELL